MLSVYPDITLIPNPHNLGTNVSLLASAFAEIVLTLPQALKKIFANQNGLVPRQRERMHILG